MHFMTRDEASTRMLVSASLRRRTKNRPAEGPAAKQQAGLGVLSDNAPLHKSIARLHGTIPAG